ncbi:DoxX family protein [Frondihabitans cladoniiphilus]|uniref:Membrane protein n=1 Tax=Frondihabitans cladoniiphilus TaxID=715785 RepID=A0ABP8W997_9MICO
MSSTKKSKKSARRDVTRMIGLLGGSGAIHLARPKTYEGIVPEVMPGSANAWVKVSGVAELGIAGLLLLPPTRKLGATLAALLLVAVFPANVKMARDFAADPTKSSAARAVSIARLPLQVPMVTRALRIRRAA